jgi:hypothetical protein
MKAIPDSLSGESCYRESSFDSTTPVRDDDWAGRQDEQRVDKVVVRLEAMSRVSGETEVL